jgi:hypothetical protein
MLYCAKLRSQFQITESINVSHLDESNSHDYSNYHYHHYLYSHSSLLYLNHYSPYFLKCLFGRGQIKGTWAKQGDVGKVPQFPFFRWGPLTIGEVLFTILRGKLRHWHQFLQYKCTQDSLPVHSIVQ